MTSTLSRYVMRAVLGTTLLVMLVLLTLSGLYIFCLLYTSPSPRD